MATKAVPTEANERQSDANLSDEVQAGRVCRGPRGVLHHFHPEIATRRVIGAPGVYPVCRNQEQSLTWPLDDAVFLGLIFPAHRQSGRSP